jgi:hypothetical protein
VTDGSLVKFPSRSRPRLFFETLAKWYADETARFLVTLDEDDHSLPDYLRGLGVPRVKVRVGTCKSKVEAVNDGLAEEDFTFLVVASDDMTPCRHDYAAYLRRVLFDRFPDGDGVLHVNDGRTGRDLNTVPILGRAYFDRFGYVYRCGTKYGADGYVSVYCDN